jgi:hypothetical protein
MSHGIIRARLLALNPSLAKPEAQTRNPTPKSREFKPRDPPLPPALAVGALKPTPGKKNGLKPIPGYPGQPPVLKLLKPEVGSKKSGSTQNGHRQDFGVP